MPCLDALSRAYCKCHRIDCVCCVKWRKLLCTTIVASLPSHPGSQQCIGRWLGCTSNPNLRTPLTHAFCHECKVLHCTLHVSILCQLEICVGLRQFWAGNLVAAAAAAFVVAAIADVNTRPGVWICRKWYGVPPQFPQNANG